MTLYSNDGLITVTSLSYIARDGLYTPVSPSVVSSVSSVASSGGATFDIFAGRARSTPTTVGMRLYPITDLRSLPQS
jgi:hypothetical protein